MKNVMVVGSINLDVTLSVADMPRAGESIYCLDRVQAGGGKGANQALALHNLGIPTLFCGALGEDEAALFLEDTYRRRGLSTRLLLKKTGATGTAFILLERSGENRIIVDPGANERFTIEDAERIVIPALSGCELLLLQLEIPLEVVAFLIESAQKLGVRAIVDAGPIRGCRLAQLKDAWCVSPNESELEALTGLRITDKDSLNTACRKVLAAGPKRVLVKLGNRGSFYMDGHSSFFAPAYRVDTVDSTAAGDSFIAGFAAGLHEGRPLPEAVDMANRCGALAVTKKGSYPSLPTRESLNEFTGTHLHTTGCDSP